MRSRSSGVSPELESATTASWGVIMPRSPWLASAGWAKSAGVRVDARLAAILRATWPLLPMPVTTTRPSTAASRSTTSAKALPTWCARTRSASASAVMTRRALATAGLAAASRSAASSRSTPARSAVTSLSPVPSHDRVPGGPLAGQRGTVGRGLSARCGSVGEDVLLGPARQVELGPHRQEGEAGSGEVPPALAFQHDVQPLAELVQVGHVAGGVAELRFAELGSPPVRALLALVELDPEQLATEILQAVPVRVGAGELRGHLGAVDRGAGDAQELPQHCDVEAREVEQLQPCRVAQQPAQDRSLVAAGSELDEVRHAVAGRELDDAEAVPARVEAHRLGVDGDRRPEVQACRQIATMQLDPHARRHPPSGAFVSTGCSLRSAERAALVVPRRGLEPPRLVATGT